MRRKISLISVVDANPLGRVMVASMLEAAGLHSVTHKSGMDFLQTMDQQFIPDCVVIGQRKGDGSGFDVLAGLLQSDFSVPAVVIGEGATAHDRELAGCLGANVYLAAPFTMQELVNAITAAILQHSFVQQRTFHVGLPI